MEKGSDMFVTEHESTHVLVVGGSLVGLSAAVFLAWRGVPVVLVERHRGSALHPRAIGYTTRTLELFRAVGITLPPTAHGDGPPRRARVASLAGAWFEEYPWTREDAAAPPVVHSPVRANAIAQDRLEPILRDRAVELGADLRLGTEAVGFAQDDGGVSVTLRRHDGSQYPLRARYVVSADGAGSGIRDALGIGRHGRGLLSVQRSILFRAPLEEYLEKGVVQFEIHQPGFPAFLTTYADGRWVLMLGDDRELSEEQQRDAIRRAIGRDDLPIELITTGRWELAALIADRFSRGRVFLVGDAAHQLPPNRGGYGANTGIEDVHNLAWKLAAVLAGTARPDLLATYDAERRPIAELRHDQIFARADYKAHIEGQSSDMPIIDDVAMELGQLYRSAALPGVGADLAPARRPDQWLGQPGTRAPHLPVRIDGVEGSPLDLFQRGWVLLAEDRDWGDAAAAAARALGVDVRFVLIGQEVTTDRPGSFGSAYGLEPDGASLIRPDGYVAWRSVSAPQDRPSALIDALTAAAMPVLPQERRLRRLEDVEAITAVTNRYADAVNHGYRGKGLEPQALADVFTEDTVYYGAEGDEPTRGLQAIVTELPVATADVGFAMHAFLNPMITITGDTACGSWLMWVPRSSPTTRGRRT
jgi:2-polyprenyl-6-methoxyphenol hydroxylase-like FAD-dependent oxidoreductase